MQIPGSSRSKKFDYFYKTLKTTCGIYPNKYDMFRGMEKIQI